MVVPAVVEGVAAGRVRAAVDAVQHGVFLARVEAGRVDQPHLHLRRPAHPGAAHPSCAPSLRGEQIVVEALQAARRLAVAQCVHARRVVHRVAATATTPLATSKPCTQPPSKMRVAPRERRSKRHSGLRASCSAAKSGPGRRRPSAAGRAASGPTRALTTFQRPPRSSTASWLGMVCCGPGGRRGEAMRAPSGL